MIAAIANMPSEYTASCARSYVCARACVRACARMRACVHASCRRRRRRPKPRRKRSVDRTNERAHGVTAPQRKPARGRENKQTNKQTTGRAEQARWPAGPDGPARQRAPRTHACVHTHTVTSWRLWLARSSGNDTNHSHNPTTRWAISACTI
jgi:hypothetical protein